MPLSVTFFRVNKGDSILLKYEEGESKHFALIDSDNLSTRAGSICPALEELHRQDVQKLDSFVLTHFHGDHFGGFSSLSRQIEIGKIVIPPVFNFPNGGFEKFLERARSQVRDLAERTDDPDLVGPKMDLGALLKFIKEHPDNVEQLNGPNSNVVLFSGSALCSVAYLPMPRDKGRIRQVVAESKWKFDDFPEANDFSLALGIDFRGGKVLLTGDSTTLQWQEHQRTFRRDNVVDLGYPHVKIPHHGSKKNIDSDILTYWNSNTADISSIISANGSTHPDEDTLKLLADAGANMFCTNRSKHCNEDEDNERENLLRSVSEVERTFLRHYPIASSRTSRTPCKGDICLTISDAGEISIKSEYGTPCVYSSDFSFPVVTGPPNQNDPNA